MKTVNSSEFLPKLPRRTQSACVKMAPNDFACSCYGVRQVTRCRGQVKEFSDADGRRRLSTSQNGNFVAALRLALRSHRCRRTISQAADLAGVSVRTLQRKLAVEGLTFSELVEQVRTELSSELLKETDLSLNQISKELGYSTVSNFSRAFQHWSGKRPTEYRRG